MTEKGYYLNSIEHFIHDFQPLVFELHVFYLKADVRYFIINHMLNINNRTLNKNKQSWGNVENVLLNLKAFIRSIQGLIT